MAANKRTTSTTTANAQQKGRGNGKASAKNASGRPTQLARPNPATAEGIAAMKAQNKQRRNILSGTLAATTAAMPLTRAEKDAAALAGQYGKGKAPAKIGKRGRKEEPVEEEGEEEEVEEDSVDEGEEEVEEGAEEETDEFSDSDGGGAHREEGSSGEEEEEGRGVGGGGSEVSALEALVKQNDQLMKMVAALKKNASRARSSPPAAGPSRKRARPPPSSLPPPASSQKANSAMRKRVQNHVRDFVEKGMLKLDAKYNAQPEPEAVSQTWEKSAAFFGVTGGEILAIAVGYHTTL